MCIRDSHKYINYMEAANAAAGRFRPTFNGKPEKFGQFIVLFRAFLVTSAINVQGFSGPRATWWDKQSPQYEALNVNETRRCDEASRKAAAHLIQSLAEDDQALNTALQVTDTEDLVCIMAALHDAYVTAGTSPDAVQRLVRKLNEVTQGTDTVRAFVVKVNAIVRELDDVGARPTEAVSYTHLTLPTKA